MYWQRFKTLEERFWEKVLVGDSDDCWLWGGSSDKYGRGRFRGMDRNEIAPRMAFELMRSPIPDGVRVLHRCDNPRCVNPKHLFLGTQKDNVKDCIAKRRFVQNSARPGGRHHFAKLNAEQVGAMRALSEQGLHAKTLSSYFGVSVSQVWRILNGERWKKTCD